MKNAVLIGFILIVLWAIARFVLIPKVSAKTVAAGLQPDSTLALCPNKPNCVCSNDSGEHAIDPLDFPKANNAQWQALLDALDAQPGWELQTEEAGYVHFEARTFVMRYIDDVELYWQEGTDKVQVRSASRLGHSDLGANAKRVAKIQTIASRMLSGK